jgi:hypothetical protein
MILGILLVLALVPTAAAASVPKVSGTYTYDYMGGVTSVTLNALASSPARGTFSFARDNGVQFAGDVTCVAIDGQDAWVVADITSTPEVDYFMARVHDGRLVGGGGDAAISFAGPGTGPENCKFPYQWNMTAKWMVPITSGNILIH